MDLEKRQSELEELYNDLDQRKLVGIILELTIENIDLKKQLSIHGVSQQRELLNALADDFNDSTDTYVGQKRIENVLKAFNCG